MSAVQMEEMLERDPRVSAAPEGEGNIGLALTGSTSISEREMI
jgi:hypothetical protein